MSGAPDGRAAADRGVPAPGSELILPLTDAPGDHALVTVLADRDRDIAPHVTPGRPDPLRTVAGATLVEVRVRERTVLPGAWMRGEELAGLARRGRRRLGAADLRMPAVVLGEGPDAVLAWGESIWPLPFTRDVAIPDACRPGVHSRAQLRRIVLAAQHRIRDVGLTLWAAPDFEVPWHDVRLVPRAAWWFDLAQVPPGVRYADAAASQGVPVERLLPAGS